MRSPMPRPGLFEPFLKPSGIVVNVAPWSSEISMAPFPAQELEYKPTATYSLLGSVGSKPIASPPLKNPSDKKSSRGTHCVSLGPRSEEHTSELQSHSFISYAVF